MKKNIARIIALVLVAGMLFAFASCKQKIVVELKDSDGAIAALANAIANGGSGTGSSQPGQQQQQSQPTQPQEQPTQQQEQPTQQQEQPTQQQEQPTQQQEQPADTPVTPPTGGMPSTTQEIADFYKAAVARISGNGEAAYDKKEFQTIGDIKITGNGMVDGKIVDVVAGYMTTEEEAKVEHSDKGSDDAKRRFPAFTLTDYSKIASAKCEQAGSNYKITIVMQTEDTPRKEGSMLSQVTSSYLAKEDVDNELGNVGIISGTPDYNLFYKDFEIVAEITPDGKFVSMTHTAHVDIVINSAKILIVNLTNKSAHLDNFCYYTNFAY